MDDKSEFIRVIKQNEGILFKLSKAFSDSVEDQRDLYQEMVYQLWKSFNTFRNESKISTWIYRVALNTSLVNLDKRKKGIITHSLELDHLNIAQASMPDLEERIEQMYAQIKTLDVIERGIILLYLEGKSHSEIALITGFSKTNIGTRISRIKAKLKSKMQKT